MKATLLGKVKKFKSWDFQKLKFTEVFRNEFMNLSMDVYDVGVKTPMMHKKRPKGSNKIIIPFEGKLKVTTDTKTMVFDPEKDGISLVVIGGRENRQFENVGNVPAKVLAIYAPAFHMSEVSHMKISKEDLAKGHK